jgi:ribosomal protein S18 acetylase RimI-like enzyme
VKVSADELREREIRSLRRFYRAFAPTTDSGRTITFDGSVLASVIPAIPKHSLPNAVTYLEPTSVEPVLHELAAIYSGAGIDAWTVWVRPGDDELASALESAGHKFDGEMEVMGAIIGDCDLSPKTDLQIDAGTWLEISELNDRVYGDESPGWGAVVANGGDLARRYVGRGDDGKVLGCIVAMHVRGDCYMTFVATAEEARGRGVCSDLMRAGLRDALEAGCVTTTLEATKAGHPVYAKLGYGNLGPVRLFENRISA